MKNPNIQKIAKKYRLNLLILFGSETTTQKTKHSDLDLAFFRYQYMPPEEENRLFTDLMEAYRREDIDLINIKNTPNLLLRYEIFIKGMPIYEKKKGFFSKTRWEAYIDFMDFKRFFDQKGAVIEKNLQILTA
ncbi:nucleotidyltransferase domain-containing protein [Candidatus Peregrinibacteria bacterium]|nr:nucleotidyltransferase domain-containing protein [Candidatus Peregrinibacteria bacterium]